MNTITAKTILSSWRDGDNWFGGNYNMNIYKGCCHGCIYCDSRSDCYHVEDFDTVRVKENALSILLRDLKSKRKKGIVSTGAMSDPYNPFEEKYELTRGALKLIDQYEFGIGIATKSDLIVRDIDLLQRIKEHSPTYAKITITTLDDALCSKIEPHVAVSSKRLEAVKRLSDAGILTGVLLMPVIPFIEDTEENVAGIVKKAHENGAKFIYPAFGVTLRQNQREYFYEQLDKLFPEMKQKYIKAFGDSYTCISPNANKIRHVFASECDKSGMLYKMSDIITLIKSGYQEKQLRLF